MDFPIAKAPEKQPGAFDVLAVVSNVLESLQTM